MQSKVICRSFMGKEVAIELKGRVALCRSGKTAAAARHALTS